MATAKKEISIFGSAKPKTASASKDAGKEIVYIGGLEKKLLELQFLKAQITDLEAQLKGVTDEIKDVSKDKFVELYQEKRHNPNTFYIKDGEGCVMVIPMDKYIGIKDEERATQLIESYGEDAVSVDEKYYFNNEVLERNMRAIEKAIKDAKAISDSDKQNLLVKEVKYSVAKGFIDRLNNYGDKMESVINEVQPIITLKNCGGKMAEGGELDSDFIANIYEDGGSAGVTKVVGISLNEEAKQELSISEVEKILGREINAWDDEVIEVNGAVYKKCLLKPYYKLA